MVKIHLVGYGGDKSIDQPNKNQNIFGLKNPSALTVALIVAAVVIGGGLLGAGFMALMAASLGGFTACLLPISLLLVGVGAFGGSSLAVLLLIQNGVLFKSWAASLD